MRQFLSVGNAVLLLLILLATAACGGEAPTTQAAPPAAAATTVAGVTGSGAGTPGTADWDRKVIRNANLTLVVASVEDSLAAVRDIAGQTGGFVFSSDSHYQGDDMTAVTTIQVPVDAFDGAMTRLRQVGSKVLNETTTSQDVTEEYVDLTSRIKNLQAQEDQLRALMSRAGTVDETLTVQRELSQVQGQIEQSQGRVNYLSRRTAFSSITVNLVPKAAAPPGPLGDWHPDETAAGAWTASLAVLAKIGDGLIRVVVFSWWFLPLVILLIVRLVRRRRPRPAAGGPNPS